MAARSASAASAREWWTNEPPERPLRKRSRPGAQEGVRVQQRDGGAEDRKGRREHGPWRGDVEREDYRDRLRRAGAHYGPEAGDAARQEIDCGLQGAQGTAGGHERHAARRADVRVSRPTAQHRAPPGARLPRRVAQGVRRPRQFHAGAQGSAAVSGNRLHEGRQGAWDERVGGDDGEDRSGGAQAAPVDRYAVQGGLTYGNDSEDREGTQDAE